MPRIINSQVGSTKALLCESPMAARAAALLLDQFKMDVHALKRVKALLNRVGIIRFHELLDQL